MSDDLALVDSNILVYALFRQCEHHERCRALLDQSQAGHIGLCVASQNLAEFYAIVTDPRRVAVSREPAEALDAIERMLAMPGMTLLPTPTDVVYRWIALARRHPATRGGVFDLQLVATMLGNDIHKIYTFNRADFEPFDEIEILAP
jgi:toxin-antitoxin system PIN domain toxin